MTNNIAPFQSTQSVSLSAQSARVIGSSSGDKTSSGKDAAREAANEFEMTFLNTMLQSMFEGVETQAPFGGGYGEDVFRSMLVSEYAKEISASGGIGLADDVYREILAQQEGRNK